jgi:hypothetical protein
MSTFRFRSDIGAMLVISIDEHTEPRLLNERDAETAVKVFQGQLAAWDGPENAAHFLKETYG